MQISPCSRGTAGKTTEQPAELCSPVPAYFPSSCSTLGLGLGFSGLQGSWERWAIMISLCTHLAHPLTAQPHRAQLRGADQGTPLPGSLSWALRAGSGSFVETPIAPSTHHPVLLTWPPARLLQALKAETWSVLLPVVWHFSEEINAAHIGAVTSSTTSVPPRPHPQKTGILGAVLFVSHHVSFLSVFLAVLLSLLLHVQVLTIRFLPHPLITPALCTPSHYPHSQSNLLSRGSLP